MIAGWVAAAALLAGATCVYLSTPHQSLLTGQGHRRQWRIAGAGLLAIAQVLLLTVQGPATAIFTAATGAMLVWSVVPIAARWWRFRREATL